MRQPKSSCSFLLNTWYQSMLNPNKHISLQEQGREKSGIFWPESEKNQDHYDIFIKFYKIEIFKMPKNRNFQNAKILCFWTKCNQGCKKMCQQIFLTINSILPAGRSNNNSKTNAIMFIRFLEKGPYYNIKIWALYVKATPNSHTPFFRQCSCTRYISTTSFI